MPQILVVEDDVLIGMLLRTMLEEMDLGVCAVATTQKAAVEAALRLLPDLLLVDVRLGGGSGIAAVEEIERHGKVPHIFMSGARMPPANRGAPALMKPFGRQDLSRAIRQALPVSALC